MSVTVTTRMSHCHAVKMRSTQVLLLRRQWSSLHYQLSLILERHEACHTKRWSFLRTKSTRERARTHTHTHITTVFLVISLSVSICESVSPDRTIVMCTKGIPSTIKQSTGSVHFKHFVIRLKCCKFICNNSIRNNGIIYFVENFSEKVITSFSALSQSRKEGLLASSGLSVLPRGTTRFALHEFSRFLWYLSTFRESFQKIQVSSKSDKNNG
jgi:hypothetical protein